MFKCYAMFLLILMQNHDFYWEYICMIFIGFHYVLVFRLSGLYPKSQYWYFDTPRDAICKLCHFTQVDSIWLVNHLLLCEIISVLKGIAWKILLEHWHCFHAVLCSLPIDTVAFHTCISCQLTNGWATFLLFLMSLKNGGKFSMCKVYCIISLIQSNV